MPASKAQRHTNILASIYKDQDRYIVMLRRK